MSNGGACCLLQVCCDRAAAIDDLAKGTGLEREYCEKVFAYMDRKHVVFAPASMRAVIEDIVQAAEKHPK